LLFAGVVGQGPGSELTGNALEFAAVASGYGNPGTAGNKQFGGGFSEAR
jgi:hypothetical protein